MMYSPNLIAVAGLALAVAAPAAADNKQAMIDEAMSAAPPTIAETVKIMDWNGNVLREGDGQFTCFPTPPSMPPGKAPMCMDHTWMAWGDAWMNKKPFKAENVGVSYMLAGDAGASNIDPYAEKATADNQWIVEGSHVMIIVPDAKVLDSFPTDYKTGGPYVMWKGTPYQHIMVPIGARPAQ